MLLRGFSALELLGAILIIGLVGSSLASVEIKAGFDEACEEDTECIDGLGDYGVCLEKFCKCNEKAVYSEDRKRCFVKAEIVGATCEVSEQCTQGSPGEFSRCHPQQLICQCTPVTSYATEDNSTCLQIQQKLGSTCVEDKQCFSGVPGEHSECVAASPDMPDYKSCQCKEYALTIPQQPNKCFKAVEKIGFGPCSTNVQCTTKIGDLSRCNFLQSKCECMPNSITNHDLTKCLAGVVRIGEPCEEEDASSDSPVAPCVGNPGVSSTCSHTGICDCLGGFTPSSWLDNCLPIAKGIGDVCEESHQCQQGTPGLLSECIPMETERRCNCTSEAITGGDDDVCFKKASLVGEECKMGAQCRANLVHSDCFEGSCMCLEHSVASRDQTHCLLKQPLGVECEEDRQCNQTDMHAVCWRNGTTAGKTCQCDEGLGYVRNPIVDQGNTCIRLAQAIGESCSEHYSQCEGFLEGAHCNNETEVHFCSCDAADVASLNKKKCLPLQASLRDPCVESQQCQATNSICPQLLRQCSCKSYFIEKINTNQCIPVRHEIGEECEDIAQCAALGAHEDTVPCLNNICQCEPGKQFFNKLCVSPASLNKPCDSHDECHLGVNNLTTCVGNATQKLCRCLPSAIEENGSCWETKTVGSGCSKDEECMAAIVGPVHCSTITKTCTCESGSKDDTSGIRCSLGNVIRNGWMGLVITLLVTLKINILY